MEEDPGLDGDVGVGWASGEDEGEFGADYVKGVDLACGAERELADGLGKSASGDLAHAAVDGHVDRGVRPLNDFDVDLVVGGYVEDAAHKDLAESIGFEGLEVGDEFGGRHNRYLLIGGIGARSECITNSSGSQKGELKDRYRCLGKSREKGQISFFTKR